MPGPAPTVGLEVVRSTAKPAAGIMLWNAEPSPGLEQIEVHSSIHFLDMDRVLLCLFFSCRVPRCEAIW